MKNRLAMLILVSSLLLFLGACAIPEDYGVDPYDWHSTVSALDLMYAMPEVKEAYYTSSHATIGFPEEEKLRNVNSTVFLFSEIEFSNYLKTRGIGIYFYETYDSKVAEFIEATMLSDNFNIMRDVKVGETKTFSMVGGKTLTVSGRKDLEIYSKPRGRIDKFFYTLQAVFDVDGQSVRCYRMSDSDSIDTEPKHPFLVGSASSLCLAPRPFVDFDF